MTSTSIFRAPGFGGLMLFMGLVQAALSFAQAAEHSANFESSGIAISINSEHLIELYQSTPDLQIIDTRLYEDHRLGHIERSLSLPAHKMDCAELARIVGSRNQPIVFYCNLGHGSSTRAIEIAANCGYQRLFRLEGGFVEWKDKDYPFVIE